MGYELEGVRLSIRRHGRGDAHERDETCIPRRWPVTGGSGLDSIRAAVQAPVREISDSQLLSLLSYANV